MKQTFRVTGMSCGGCVSSVEKALNEISGVTGATVSLPENAIVEMDTRVPIEMMQEALKKIGNYRIMEASNIDVSQENIDKKSCCGGNQNSSKENEC